MMVKLIQEKGGRKGTSDSPRNHPPALNAEEIDNSTHNPLAELHLEISELEDLHSLPSLSSNINISSTE